MYKNKFMIVYMFGLLRVSILVLMDLCIKTQDNASIWVQVFCFNPCFNGSMYKNSNIQDQKFGTYSFNPCFNGSMYKNIILTSIQTTPDCFNPCFNGSMYKNRI